MTWLVLIFIIAASVSSAPTDETYDNRLKSFDEENSDPVAAELTINNSKKEKQTSNDDNSEGNVDDNNSKNGEWISPESNQQLTTNTAIISETKNSDVDINEQLKEKKLKKGRKHKALFIDYPFVPQLSAIPNFEAYDELQGSEERTPGGGGGRKRYPESNIYYIRLPPTPYMFVPGLGYVSQPPSYSTGPMRPQIAHVRPQVNPYRPHNVYSSPINDINPFINLPLDFVSNGKPTSVYQWQSASYQPIKRPDTQITTLDKGPYFFNGRPHGIYLLRQDPRPQVHQALQFPDYQDNSYY